MSSNAKISELYEFLDIGRLINCEFIIHRATCGSKL